MTIPVKVLEGTRVRLVPLDIQRDAQALYAASHGSAEKTALWDFLFYYPYPTFEAFMDDTMGYFAALRDGHYVTFTVFDVASNAAIGVANFSNVFPEHRRLEIGHLWYTPSMQRTGANTETCYLLLKYAFEELGYRRVEWKCDNLHVRSKAAAVKLGFVPEGLFRQHMWLKGKNRDTSWFAMIDADWQNCKLALEQRLGN
jgi:RimJ/RimL family protein N-acetyltransferase